MEKKSKPVLSTGAHRVVLGASIVSFYGITGFLWNLSETGTEGAVSFLFVGMYVFSLVLTGTLASKLQRRTWAWVLGSIFGYLIPSVVLVFLGKSSQGIMREAIEQRKAEELQRNREKAILNLARTNGRVVTVGNAALAADISLEEAQLILDSMAKKGYASLEVKETGSIAYYFPEFGED